ncbi:hypothetical protein KC19_4G088700 [Ceratodon purpureus]|uniref:Uncharacterized protein n=1 Tax=Ceratodon purpureus TaxID=3225 RepID=A0A8T0I8D0_CERPU|nr:hypothetical protein KC19_4G088700 [Ceratodon purpureus]
MGFAEITLLLEKLRELCERWSMRDECKLLQKQQSVWWKNSFKHRNKAILYEVGNYSNKWNTDRIHQPRADM